MGFDDQQHAFVIANKYNFTPPRKIDPARIRRTNAGKYEPDDQAGEPDRFMTFAHWQDHTNILIAYEPANLDYEP